MKRKASRVQPDPWPSRSRLDIMLEPAHQTGPDKKGERISYFEAVLRNEYRRAMEGNLPSQKKILDVMRINERARAERDSVARVLRVFRTVNRCATGMRSCGSLGLRFDCVSPRAM